MNWRKLRMLGSGSYGTVFLAVNKENGGLFAVKSIHHHHREDESHVRQMKREVKLLSRLRHDNIVKYFGASSSKRGFFLYTVIEKI